MLIANPIYDTVFKYLMDDLPVAKLIISTIIGEEIEELAFKQRERSTQIAALGVSIFRLDFSAVIKTSDGGKKNVIIELQKADGGEDIPRFRRYLAENYYAPVGKDSIQDDQSESTLALNAPVIPIVSIYILGFPLESLKGHSAVTVQRKYYDAVTGEELSEREDFIECLTHDSHVIQISELKQRRRVKLEWLFSMFEQMNLQANKHLKEFSDALPDEFHIILDRLSRAALDRKIREEMEIEDEFLASWRRRERSYEKALDEGKVREEEERRLKEEERRLKEEAKAREEEAKAREEEAKAREEEAKTREEEERRQKEEERKQKEEERRLKEEERRQKEALMAQLDSALKALIAAGHSEQQARNILRFDSK